MTDVTDEQRDVAAAQAAGFRAIADLIEHHPDLAFNKNACEFTGWYSDDREFLALLARTAKAHGATVTKEFGGTLMTLVLAFGPIRTRNLAKRDAVCEWVPTGTKTVTEEVPDPVALAAVPMVEQTREVETGEWVCGSLLAPAEKATGQDAEVTR